MIKPLSILRLGSYKAESLAISHQEAAQGKKNKVPLNVLPLVCFIMGSFAFFNYAIAHPDHYESNVPNPKDLTYDQKDPTDIYAIPLDNSERDLEEELEDIEALEQSNLQKKQTQRR